MAEVRVTIPDDVWLKIKQASNIDWSVMASRLIKEKFEKIARLKRIASKSKLSEEKALEMAEKISASLAKRYETLKR